MSSIIQSVVAIGIIMVVGWLGRRIGLLPEATEKVLVDLVYWFLAPAMLFSTISRSDVHQVFGTPLAVAACAGLLTVVFFVLLAWPIFKPSFGELAMGAMSASLNNAAFIGIPVATYVLGNAIHGVPIMVFQLGCLSPTFFVIADLVGSHSKPTAGRIVKTVLKNPMVISALIAFLISWFNVTLPELVTIPIDMVGEAGSAVILIAFGCSIYGKRLKIGNRDGRIAVLATLGKLVIQPLAALGIGLLLGLRGADLMAVTVMAALPTANNAFVAARRAGVDLEVPQETILMTTFLSMPMVVLIAWIFHQFFGVAI